MTCGKCGAELNASAKFCASCGAPTATPPSASSAANLLAEAMPAIAQPEQTPSNLLLIDMPADASPVPKSMVNPFAVTATPSKRPSSKPPPGAAAASGPCSEPQIEAKADSVAGPPSPRAVSPLAVSNGISGRTPFSEALDKARQSVAPGAPEKKSVKKPGTYVMANAPVRPGSKPGSEPPPPAEKKEEPPKKKAVPKTVAMGPIPRPTPPQQPAPGSVSPGMPHSVGAPQSVGMPPHSGMPGSFVSPSQRPPAAPWGQTPQSPAYQPQPIAQPLAPYQPAPQYPAPQWGGYPAAAPGFPPGSRVQVKWSNGQRYPATVSQVNGQQHLVRFPDGQQHWVDVQYLTPG
jgi:hypothetical protein